MSLLVIFPLVITSHVMSLLVIFPLVLVIANALVLVLLVLVRCIWSIWIYSLHSCGDE